MAPHLIFYPQLSVKGEWTTVVGGCKRNVSWIWYLHLAGILYPVLSALKLVLDRNYFCCGVNIIFRRVRRSTTIVVLIVESQNISMVKTCHNLISLYFFVWKQAFQMTNNAVTVLRLKTMHGGHMMLISSHLIWIFRTSRVVLRLAWLQNTVIFSNQQRLTVTGRDTSEKTKGLRCSQSSVSQVLSSVLWLVGFLQESTLPWRPWPCKEIHLYLM